MCQTAFILFSCCLLLVLQAQCSLASLELNILHFNDFHARFEQTSVGSSTCKEDLAKKGKCYGGLARMYQAIQERRQNDNQHTLLFNAGDMYQGTVWYTLFKHEAMIPFMNKFNMTACALGNHEFDDSPDGLLPLAKKAQFPIVCANCDFTEIPEFRGLIKPYQIVEVDGRKIGIIGYLTPNTRNIATTGRMLLRDEVNTLTKVSNQLKGEGIDIIIGLGHSGYEKDKEIAHKVPHLDLVIGAHSHSFLYNSKWKLPSSEVPSGQYPTIIKQPGGRSVPVVQAYAFTKYLGSVKLHIDDQGEVTRINGKPILLDSSIEQNTEVMAMIQKWKSRLSHLENLSFGETEVILEGNVRNRETNLGDYFSDGVLKWFEDNTSIMKRRDIKYNVALINSGSLRANYEAGKITVLDMKTVQPFENTIDYCVAPMRVLKEALQYSASLLTPEGNGDSGAFLQVGGMKMTIDLSRPHIMNRITRLLLQHSDEPGYVSPDDEEPVRIFTTSYILSGKDGYHMFKSDDVRKGMTVGPVDVDVFKWYLNKTSPVNQRTDGRITVINAQTSGEAGRRRKDTGQGSNSSSSQMTLSSFGVLLILTNLLHIISSGS